MQEGVDVVDDIGVSRSTHDEDLVDDEILLGLLVEVHLLDGHREVRADLVRGVDTARSTEMMSDVMSVKTEWNNYTPGADLDQVPVQLRRVRIRADLLQPLHDVRLLRDVLLLLLASPWGSASSGSSLLQAGSSSTGGWLRRGTPSLPLAITYTR